MRGSITAMGRAAGEQHGVVQPIPSPIEISLADLLFPPSPPLVASTSTPSASLASSPTIVENSGDDLPSPVQFRSLSSRIPLSTTTTKSRETRLVPETIVDSSEDDKEERERIKSLKSQRRKGKGRPSQTIYILDDSEDDRVTSAAPKPSTSKSNGRARRRITISIDVESSSSESDTALALIPSRRPHRTLQPTTPASTRIPKSKPIPTQTEECVCVGDSEEEREGVEREAVVSLPTETTTGGTPQPKENDCSDPFATEYDPYAGVLTYEPSHRNPVRFRKSLLDCLNVPITPSRADKPVKKIKPRVEIDLTLSSSDESEFIPATKPRTPQSALPPPPREKRLEKRLLATPAKAAPKTTSTRKLADKDSLTPERRNALAIDWIRQLDKAVFRKRWNGLRCLDGEGEENGEGLPSDIAISWSKTLRTTAGTASWKKHKTNLISIDLSIKVLDTVEKLRSTLSHELVHVAAWILSGETKPSHGKAFFLWGQRVTKKFPEIIVTTKHSYEIAYKFRWRCLDVARCGKIFSRHSNSIDTERQGCQCGSRIARIDADGNLKAPPKRTLWDDFRSTVSVQIRRDNPSVSQSEIFKMVAVRWNEEKLRAGKELERTTELMGKIAL